MNRPKHECDERFDWRYAGHRPMNTDDAYFLIALGMWPWQRALYMWDWNEPMFKKLVNS